MNTNVKQNPFFSKIFRGSFLFYSFCIQNVVIRYSFVIKIYLVINLMKSDY